MAREPRKIKSCRVVVCEGARDAELGVGPGLISGQGTQEVREVSDLGLLQEGERRRGGFPSGGF